MGTESPNILPLEAVQRHIQALHADPQRRAKLLKTCDGLAYGLDCLAEDLLQDACIKALNGERKWPEHVSPEAFLTEVIRSLADARRKALQTGMVDYGMDDALYAKVSHSVPSGERDNPQVRVAEADASRQRLQELLRHFDGDRQVQGIILRRGAGEEGKEIMAALGLTWEQYRAACKRMERGLGEFRKLQT